MDRLYLFFVRSDFRLSLEAGFNGAETSVVVGGFRIYID
jgi:hypothetical protein